jgi:ribosome-associated protein
MEKNSLLTACILKHIVISTARSGGKGGQHVNKVSTKVELFFDIKNSLCLDDEQKQSLYVKLKNKISTEGVLHISEDSERSQLRNKKLAEKKLLSLIEKSFHKEKKRLATKPTNASKIKKEKKKRAMSELKVSRKKIQL